MIANKRIEMTSYIDSNNEYFWSKLEDIRAFKTAEAFDIDRGHLGAAYICACLQKLDESRDWKAKCHEHLGQIFLEISKNPYPHAGMLGGLTGLAFLLRAIGDENGDYQNASTKLERKLRQHLKEQTDELEHGVGANRFTYDYALGISGTLYCYTIFSPREQETVETIERATRVLEQKINLRDEGGLWTSPVDIPQELVATNPKSVFGILDLGQAHGITGVLTALLAAGKTPRSNSIQALIQILTLSAERSMTLGVPYYLNLDPKQLMESQLFPFQPKAIEASSPARNGWCYGIPMLEYLDKSYNLNLPNEIASAYQSTANTNPNIGEFSGPGLCHGIAGRLAINYELKNQIPEAWFELAEQFLKRSSVTSEWGFWDGIAGLHIICSAIHKSVPLPPPIRIIGLRPRGQNK